MYTPVNRPGAVSRLKFTHMPMDPPTRKPQKNKQKPSGCQNQQQPPQTPPKLSTCQHTATRAIIPPKEESYATKPTC